jgi:phosphate transport system substrate-binding protein
MRLFPNSMHGAMKTRLGSIGLVVGLTLACSLAMKDLAAADSNPLRIQGSTTLFAPVKALSERYMKDHPGLSIVNHASSSGQGIRDLINGKADIARSSRPLMITDQVAAMTKGSNIVSTPIGRDGVMVIVHPDKYAQLRRISVPQLRKIFFNGSISSWEQLQTGLSGEINIYVRDNSDSGTGYRFTQLIAGDSSVPFVSTAIYLSRTPELRDAVARDVNGIAFLPADMVDTSVVSLMIGDENSTYTNYDIDNPDADNYPLYRVLYLVTKDPPSVDEQAFVDYAKSPQAFNIMRKYKILPAP